MAILHFVRQGQVLMRLKVHSSNKVDILVFWKYLRDQKYSLNETRHLGVINFSV